DGELFVGEIGAGELEVLGDVRLIDVHDGRLGVGPPGLELFEAVLAEVDLIATRSVVVGGHRIHTPNVRVAPGVTRDGGVFVPTVSTNFTPYPCGAPPPRGTPDERGTLPPSRGWFYAHARK